MLRFLAGAAACFLLMTGAFLIWQSHAQQSPTIASDRLARSTGSPWFGSSDEPLQAPEASEKTREEKRFSRVDKDKNGKVEREEMLVSRRKAFAKLDANNNGSLSFDEWAVKTITKFNGADKDRSGWLSPAEYATTAPPRKPRRGSCSCNALARAPAAVPTDDSND